MFHRVRRINGGLPGGILGLWRCNEASGQVAYDGGALGNHLQLGSTSGTDTDDPAWSGGVLVFSGANYLRQQALASKVGTVTLSLAAGVGFINDSGQNFAPYVGVSGLSKPYMLVVTDLTILHGLAGCSFSAGQTTCVSKH